ncbi:MAG: hypothetical protein DCF25_09980 [Leptolyngbya foveolarum]|uniref:DUF1802 domain-containing protein n=1 Tax=Leptolyngbya foveolarum TaxID=47253 RepID=A0A2W4UBN1_9CYAN|nr:MAG: hypothetical protein DCF25_09980 [Leptolyngbya foveolarum]
MDTIIQAALKEWSVAVDALSRGETIVLLRKGGIKEHKGRFTAQAERAVLFPTFEHQKPELLKPHYQSLVPPVSSGWHPPTIELKAWAEISDIFLTTDEEKVLALADFHIWRSQLAQERLKWKPQQPLYVMALRVYLLAEPMIIPWTESYRGCRSWVDLDEALVVEKALPAIAETDYKAEVAKIEALLS